MKSNELLPPSTPLSEFDKIKESAKSIATQEAAEGSWSWLNVYVGCLEAEIKTLLKGKAGIEKKLDLILERVK